MSEEQNSLDEIITSLKRERDELKLQMHLAGMEAKDEYERLSGKFEQLTQQYEPIGKAVDETAGNVVSALKLAGEEMLSGFQRVRKAIQDS